MLIFPYQLISTPRFSIGLRRLGTLRRQDTPMCRKLNRFRNNSAHRLWRSGKRP